MLAAIFGVCVYIGCVVGLCSLIMPRDPAAKDEEDPESEEEEQPSLPLSPPRRRKDVVPAPPPQLLEEGLFSAGGYPRDTEWDFAEEDQS